MIITTKTINGNSKTTTAMKLSSAIKKHGANV